MIERYAMSEVDAIWNTENRLAVWWKVEQAVCAGWHQLNVIDNHDWRLIESKKININITRMNELELQTKHDVVAFTRMISEQMGDERRWIHLGITSTDVVDTGQNYLIKQSNVVLLKFIDQLVETLKAKAIEYRSLVVMGRTHGIYGEPTSLGLKFLLWYEEWQRHVERLAVARKQIEVVKISGSMGNFAHVEPMVEKTVSEMMDLDIDPISTQVTQRDCHSFLLSVFANMASTLEKMATEVRLYQQSEVGEWMEGFSVGQKGSSSMPHKKNPISSENICGLSRLMQGNAIVALQNNVLWHERDISHSSNERIILPDSYHLLVYTIKRMNDVLQNLVIDRHAMQQHISDCNNIFYSQPIMTEILKTNKASRETVYDFIQQATLQCQRERKDFLIVLQELGIKKYLSKERLEKICNINYFLRNIDAIYGRVL